MFDVAGLFFESVVMEQLGLSPCRHSGDLFCQNVYQRYAEDEQLMAASHKVCILHTHLL